MFLLVAIAKKYIEYHRHSNLDGGLKFTGCSEN